MRLWSWGSRSGSGWTDEWTDGATRWEAAKVRRRPHASAQEPAESGERARQVGWPARHGGRAGRLLWSRRGPSLSPINITTQPAFNILAETLATCWLADGDEDPIVTKAVVNINLEV